ncbi:hypothetical protein [Butyrivibrio sp. FCS014]|uniref:hypothetical protein n=1 Tax=Butyrivibrio sp. FCS014 TaxID=1408304 RepID=UPI0004B80BC3|nr:hypothetical protein [Butyrivibrio sp. FCS014]
MDIDTKEKFRENRDVTLPQKMPSHYRISLHIDDEEVVQQNARSYGYRVLRICDPDPDWVQKVLDEAERVRKIEENNN